MEIPSFPLPLELGGKDGNPQPPRVGGEYRNLHPLELGERTKISSPHCTMFSPWDLINKILKSLSSPSIILDPSLDGTNNKSINAALLKSELIFKIWITLLLNLYGEAIFKMHRHTHTHTHTMWCYYLEQSSKCANTPLNVIISA